MSETEYLVLKPRAIHYIKQSTCIHVYDKGNQCHLMACGLWHLLTYIALEFTSDINRVSY